MTGRETAFALLSASVALGGCSDSYTPASEELATQFETGAIVDLDRFVPGTWSAICLHGQYETVRGSGPNGAPALTCTGDRIPFDSDYQRISFVTEDNRCFSIAMPKGRLRFETKTECYRQRDGFRFQLQNTANGTFVRHVSNG